MSRVRQKDTAAEVSVAKSLRRLGAAYRKNVRSLPGSPDFANRRRGWAVFVHGCFWHQHCGCKRATIPKANDAFWRDKFERNRARDANAVRMLESAGFRVGIVWECEAQEPDAKLREVLEPGRVDVRQTIDH